MKVTSAGCAFWEAQLLFRDYLRTPPTTVEAYAARKRELAAREWHDINEYAYAKTELSEAMKHQAVTWKTLPEA